MIHLMNEEVNLAHETKRRDEDEWFKNLVFAVDPDRYDALFSTKRRGQHRTVMWDSETGGPAEIDLGVPGDEPDEGTIVEAQPQTPQEMREVLAHLKATGVLA